MTHQKQAKLSPKEQEGAIAKPRLASSYQVLKNKQSPKEQEGAIAQPNY
jgi:hypothetical protein